MSGAPNRLNVSWQFYSSTVDSDAFYSQSENRSFKYDKQIFDHFNIVPTAVSDS